MSISRFPVCLIHLVAATLAAQSPRAATTAREPGATRNVIFIVTDGMRWQEVFRGADSLLLNRSAGGVEDTASLRRDFWRGTVPERRAALMPFLWGTIAREGQLYGDRDSGSTAAVTNGLKFSYPGYNEMLTGRPDPRIDRNDYGPNPNATVLEWLNGRAGFEGRVAAFGTWEAFDDIFNRGRSRMYVRAGWEAPFPPRGSAADSLIDALYAGTTRYWTDLAWDALGHAAAMDYLASRRPRVLFIGYGETDEWAHEGRYDLYLRAAHHVDAFLAEVWRTVQSLDGYRGHTTLIITTDHGRGEGPARWRDHGRTVDGAEDIWIAVLGPDTPALGVLSHAAPVTQSQLAATVATLLGADYARAVPGVAPPLAPALAPH